MIIWINPKIEFRSKIARRLLPFLGELMLVLIAIGIAGGLLFLLGVAVYDLWQIFFA